MKLHTDFILPILNEGVLNTIEWVRRWCRPTRIQQQFCASSSPGTSFKIESLFQVNVHWKVTLSEILAENIVFVHL